MKPETNKNKTTKNIIWQSGQKEPSFYLQKKD